MDLSVLIVSYNTRELTCACLRSVIRQTRGLEYEMRVLDNASRDGSAAGVLQEFPDVHLEVLDENVGFARGVNRLAKGARGEFLLLVNPDAEIRGGAVQELVAFARENGGRGIFGGRTVGPDGGVDPAFAWSRATPWSTFCNALGLGRLLPRSALLAPEDVGKRLGPGDHEVDIVSGCFFLVQRALWQELGGFDPRFFVYGEEADLCLRAARAGVRPVSTSRATVLHHGGASESSLEGKVVKLLAAKRRLMILHWAPGSARLGLHLLALHVLLRCAGFTALALAHPERFATRARSWRAVWRRRDEWRLRGEAGALLRGTARARGEAAS